MKKLIAFLVMIVCVKQIHPQMDTTIVAPKSDTVIIAPKSDTVIITPKSDTIIILPKIDTLFKIKDTLLLDSVGLYKLKPKAKVMMGIASFYSKNLDGTRTATGEYYRNAKLTAASNNYKLNTWVKVTNLSNEKFVIVRINDRMHPRMAKRGRVVDLSRIAAKELDFMQKGLTKVRVEPIDL